MAASPFVESALNAGPAEVESFRRREPFAWQSWQAFLEPRFFAELRDAFPPLDRFERHESRQRGWQRPHDRYYLAYGVETRPGVVAGDGLAEPWRRAIAAFQGIPFITFLARMLGGEPRLRFAWHRSYRGSEVSPHIDASEKLGTMVFYCNAPAEWHAGWGGDTLILGDLQAGVTRPDFADFQTRIAVPALETQCLLFRTSARSWHGVERLQCPDTHFRKTFHVIAESC